MSLEGFHPACRRWFEEQFTAPTPAQADAWAAIRRGSHTLIAAPTGSGKTLAAFYAGLDRLVSQGDELAAGVQILYVSPLKALNNDIHRNLQIPLAGIAELRGDSAPEIRIAVRTGDTPADQRRKMAAHPPHILVTTPESLYLLLTSASGRAMLASVSTLIVDEIHAMLGDKRGSHLALSIERLEDLAGQASGQPLQRIGLSATQKPVETVAQFLTGAKAGNAAARNFDCEIIDAGFRRNMEISVEVPGSPLSAVMSAEVWEELYQRLVELILAHNTTLVFVNTRRLSERLALALGERLGEGVVSAHHGSMSRDHRFAAEQQLKSGQLKVLVATASMELGIDIGHVDLVVQFSSPKSIAAFLQRVGRSGHSIDGTPKGVLFPLSRDDLVEAAALLAAIRDGELDRIHAPGKPLDILAQQIIAEAAMSDEGWELDELFALLRRAWPYRNLERSEFDDVIGMLAEGYTTRRGRRGALLHLDAINGRIRARRGAKLVALTNGGAIPDMFDYQVVLDPQDVVVGTLNEDFALESLPGDVFTLGSHSWQMIRIDGLKVRVRDAHGARPTIPFWFGEGPGRSRELSEAVSGLRGNLAELLAEGGAAAANAWLTGELGMVPAAAAQLVDYLHAGMRSLGVMPTRDTIVMERFFDEVGDMHLVIHAPFGSRLNRAWGLALRKRFCRTFNFELQAAANEDNIVLSLGSVHSFPLDEVFRYLNSKTVREVVIQAMLDAPMFEVRWRWNATRSLAIQRNRNGQRVPPQWQRMDAEDLVAHVFPDQIACQENLAGKREIPDHPLVTQTVHDCLTEAMDIDDLVALLQDMEDDRLTLVSRDLREPSPFAQEIINARPYAFLDDAPFEERRTNAIRNRSWLDPAEVEDFSLLDADAIDRVRTEAWPLMSNAEELHDALLALGYMTEKEFGPGERFAGELIEQGRICRAGGLWLATEMLPRFRALFPEAAPETSLPDFLGEEKWTTEDALRDIVRGRLSGLGPVTASELADELSNADAVSEKSVESALLALQTEGFAMQGHFSPDARAGSKKSPVQWCERRLLQRIHRYTIDLHRKSIKPVSLELFTEFLFQRHGLRACEASGSTPVLDGQLQLQECIRLLDGAAAPAASWESGIYPARIGNYDPQWLDLLSISGRLAWGRYSLPSGRLRGGSPIKTTPITMAMRSNLDIWQALAGAQADNQEPIEPGADARRVEQDLESHGASFFDQIQTRTGLLRTQLEQGLAELVSLGRVCSDSYVGLRALLLPEHKKSGGRRRRKLTFGVEDAGRWSLLETFRQPSGPAPAKHRQQAWDALDEDQLQRLLDVYLDRWGVICRSLIAREAMAPPWRVLLTLLRKQELRGKLRGGRFVAGLQGEQFARTETVDELRKFGREQRPNRHFVLTAADPVNLLHLLMPERSLPRLTRNRVLYRGGVPLAVLIAGEISFLGEVAAEDQWKLRQMIVSGAAPASPNQPAATRFS
ncbi:MAG: DEAD/DEAH box helicase [Gammaproteobacteria bacterium]|nr:DEAD/DEAH box helicase [Gammaproteobacteria bacterium]MYH85162.1 DEAD/DEAH box helicase [Gammaproteobacteria bacterium]MYK05642.1 DEAD/DEAH box helicase [Gammaproteobacteria bacterium]